MRNEKVRKRRLLLLMVCLGLAPAAPPGCCFCFVDPRVPAADNDDAVDDEDTDDGGGDGRDIFVLACGWFQATPTTYYLWLLWTV